MRKASFNVLLPVLNSLKNGNFTLGARNALFSPYESFKQFFGCSEHLRVITLNLLCESHFYFHSGLKSQIIWA